MNRRRRGAFGLLIVLTVLGLSGCDRLFGVALAGTWSGTYRPLENGDPGVLLLDLQVSGSTVTGTWESSLPGTLAQGTVSGSVQSLVMLELLSVNVPDCRFSVLAEQRRSKLEGGYVSDCGAVPGGWIALERQ